VADVAAVGTSQKGPTVLTANETKGDAVLNIIAKLRARRDGNDEGGFTLIELMVVVLIIAILIAIAIPTFLGARQRAQDKAAQSSLRNALTAAKTIYTDGEDYQLATNTALVAVEPSLTFPGTGTAGASTTPKEVNVSSTAKNLIVMASFSKSGKCFYMRDNTNGPGTEFASSAAGQTECTAATPSLVGGTAWNGNTF
jgi:type IV pilus assembly protein PilA